MGVLLISSPGCKGAFRPREDIALQKDGAGLDRQAGEGWARREGPFLPRRALRPAWFPGSMEETRLPAVAFGCLVFSGRQASGIALFISEAELRSRGKSMEGVFNHFGFGKRADGFISSLNHSMDNCVHLVGAWLASN